MVLERIMKMFFRKKGAAPGKSVVIQTIAAGNQEHTVELYHPPGVSSGPTENDRVIILPVGSGVKVGIATHNYKIEVEVSAGETILYSTDSDGKEVKAQIKLDTDGNIIMNEGTDHAASFEKLKTEIEKIQNAWDTFAQAYVPGGPATQGTPPTAAQSGANIDNAKVDKVRLP